MALELEEVKAAVKAATDPLRETISQIGNDVLRLTSAVNLVNRYQGRIPEVEATCQGILSPHPDVTKANEDLASIRAAKTKLGAIINITIEWDDKWNFLTQFRGDGGYSHGEGFDLRPNTAGFKALREAIAALDVPLGSCSFATPDAARPGELMRHVIFKKNQEKRID